MFNSWQTHHLFLTLITKSARKSSGCVENLSIFKTTWLGLFKYGRTRITWGGKTGWSRCVKSMLTSLKELKHNIVEMKKNE